MCESRTPSPNGLEPVLREAEAQEVGCVHSMLARVDFGLCEVGGTLLRGEGAQSEVSQQVRALGERDELGLHP